MSYRVTANICLEVDDEEAQNEEQAKLVAVDQLSDYFRHSSWPEMLQVEKVEVNGNTEPACSHCGDPVEAIGTSISIQLVRDEATGEWSREELDLYETKQCLNCFEEFYDDELDKLGVPNELR